jgi:hypothetical protein
MPRSTCLLTDIPDAAWEALLPLLFENNTAGSVALCCRQLRHQVQQGYTQQLPLAFDTDAAIEGVDALPDRFPNCTEISIDVHDGEQIAVLSALPVLSR